MLTANHQRLVELIRRDCLQFGDFTLSSGAKSNYYLDLRKLSLSAEGATLLAELIFPRVIGVQAIGGPEMAAVPIIGAVLTRFGDRIPNGIANWNMRAFVVRKEAKKHGTGGLLVGDVRPGDRVVIIEDVVTTGAAIRRTADVVQQAGASVEFVICIVDRGGVADELASQEKRLILRPLLKLADLGIHSQ